MNLLASTLVLLASVSGTWPLSPPPPLVHPFQPPSTFWGSGHRGVDLLGQPGQEVLAAAPGTVSFAAPIAGVGIVVVSHGDTRTTYQPVTASVVPGQIVAAGEVIGRLEPAGSHCAPDACLHWGLVRGVEYLDPVTLIGAPAKVRLLPLDIPLAASPTDPSGLSSAHTGSPLRQVTAAVVGALSAALSSAVGAPPPGDHLRLTPSDAPAGTPSAAGQP